MDFDQIILIDSDVSRRGSFAHALSKHGYVVPLGSIDQILPHWPENGWILVYDDGELVEATMARLEQSKCYYPVIAYSQRDEMRRVVELLHAGVIGYLHWPVTAREVIAALAELSEVAELRCRAMRAALSAWRKLEELTQRQMQVLEAISQGQSSKVIARELGISPRTVEIHRGAAMKKLDAVNCLEAVQLVHQAENLQMLKGRSEFYTKAA